MVSAPRPTIDELLRTRELLVTCGAGGVGKTTTSAILAIRAATLGRRTVIVTMDPARRLASALGLKSVGHVPVRIDPLITALGGPALDTACAALMPETSATFAEFVHEIAPDPARAERVLRNSLFQIFTKEYSGAGEYMALQKILSLLRSGEWDLVILDTPPSRNSIQFLKAPALLAELFEEKLIRMVVRPAHRWVTFGVDKVLKILESLAGRGFMSELIDFARSLFDFQEGILKNVREITAHLRSPRSGFLWISAPSDELLPDFKAFSESLREQKFRLEGVAVNRTVGYLPEEGETNLDAVLQALRRRERSLLDALRAQLAPDQALAELPEVSRDIHRLEDLRELADRLGAGAEPVRR